MFVYFFFFKQKTAYEMRISDWSSDVCSSDLEDDDRDQPQGQPRHRQAPSEAVGQDRPEGAGCHGPGAADQLLAAELGEQIVDPGGIGQIGRASCRERVCQYV